MPQAPRPHAGHGAARRKIPSPQSVASLLRTSAQGLFSVLFPSNCRFCESPLLEISRLPVCSDCLAAIQPIAGSLCVRCGERLAAEGIHAPQSLCGNCQLEEPLFAKAAAYGSYDAGVRDLIHLLKYQQVRPAADVLGGMLAQVIENLAVEFGTEPPLVVPVPLHSTRLRERGFNHSELIARAAIERRPAGIHLKLASETLLRRRATESQTGLTSAQRRANLRGAFVTRQEPGVRGCDVLLVDDVYTTGTTVSECSRVLRKAGATRIWVATVARVLKGQMVEVEPAVLREPSLARGAVATG